MPKWQETGQTSSYDAATRFFRQGTDFRRGLYSCFRRAARLDTWVGRARAARQARRELAFEIPRSSGFQLFHPGRFAEAGEIIQVAEACVARSHALLDSGTIRKKFLVNLLSSGDLTLESPLVRLALRPDVIAGVATYLGVVPVLTSISVFWSSWSENGLKSSQLYHCDGDDTSQVKIFAFCSDVGPENGPLTVVPADTSGRIRRQAKYRYRERVRDEDVGKWANEREQQALVGQAGTVCFIDTSRCFHFGSRLQEGARPRLVAMIQYLTPFSFLLPFDYRRAAPFRHLATASSLSPRQRQVLGSA